MLQTIITFTIVIISALFIIFNIIRTVVKGKKGDSCSCCSNSNNCSYGKKDGSIHCN